MSNSPIVARKKGRSIHLSLAPGGEAQMLEALKRRTERALAVEVQHTRDNPLTLETRRASLRPSSANAEARTIEAVIATDAPVQRNGYLEILDPAGADLSLIPGAHVLNNHNQRSVEDILGAGEEGWLEGGSRVVARVRMTDRPEHASIVRAILAGDINGVSIGYDVSEWREGTDANGNRTRTAVKWRVREISFVAVPADPAARTRSANATIRELGQRSGATQSLTDSLIDRGATVEQARSAFFDELLTRSAAPLRTSHNEHSMDNHEAFIRAAGEALYTRVDPGHQPSGAARQYIGMTMPDLAREVLRRNGVSTLGMGAAQLIERAGMLTTSDFPLILANTAGRTLGAAYKRPTSGIRQLAGSTTMADFRTKSRLKLDSGFNLEKVNEAGEFKNAGLIETAEAYALKTFGRILSVSRQALVNDDLGALVDLPRHFGQAAQAFEAQALVDLLQMNSGVGPALSDGNAVHHTAHGNIAASGGAPSEATLSAARLAMRKQTSPAGALITVNPKFLLVPPELETAAEKLLSTIQAADTDDVNVFSKLVLIVEPRLTSATRWWLVSPDVDGLEYAHLAGEPGPQIATQVGFRIDGVEYRVRLDFGCGFVDWRGWYTNAGA